MFSPLGLIAYDLSGQLAGRVEATYPYDGSEPEFVVIRLLKGKWCRTRLVPLEGSITFDEDCLQFPFTLIEMEDAPSPEECRWEFEQADLARAYW
jgi:hypothetical protein